MGEKCNHIIGAIDYEYEGYTLVYASEGKRLETTGYEPTHFNYCPVCGEALASKPEGE